MLAVSFDICSLSLIRRSLKRVCQVEDETDILQGTEQQVVQASCKKKCLGIHIQEMIKEKTSLGLHLSLPGLIVVYQREDQVGVLLHI